MYLTFTNMLRGLTKEEYLWLSEMCRYSNNLYNFALYNVRQHFFNNQKFLSYNDNYHVCKNNENYKLLQSSISQQTLMIVDRNFKSFYVLSEKKTRGEYDQEVNIPHYLPKGGMFSLVLPFLPRMIKDGYFILPLSKQFKKIHPDSSIKIKVPDKIADKKIKEIRIIPVYDGKYFKIQFVYEEKEKSLDLDPAKIIAIDLGINNLASCVTTIGTSFIMDGRKLKSINQGWNKKIAFLSSVADHQGIKKTKRMASITMKRNNQVKDIMRKTARYIIDYCIEHKIGTLIIGYSLNFKENVNLGRKNNQTFTNIAFSDLRQMLEYQCKLYGIRYLEQEESYTSKSSFLDNDPIPTLNHQNKTCKEFSGKRIYRGLYRSSEGYYINADLNGAANILRKSNLHYDENKLREAVLSRPSRIKLE